MTKSHTLQLCPELPLPLDAATHKFDFLATSGAGKTYAAMKLAEEMLAALIQVVVLDPVGVWWALRLAADGKGPGFTHVYVFGGEHGDLPLTPESGAVVARLIVVRGISAVLDLSSFTTSETKRFVRDFAEEFFQAKKTHRSAVHVFVEEAQTICPQNPEKDEAVMLNRVERLLKLGRNYGVGWSLISQQPQAVNKKCLNLADCLVVLRTLGRHERKAIADTVSDKATNQTDLDLLGELPGLQTGEGFVWSPGWLRLTVRIRVGKRRTFDASATPEFGAEAAEPRLLAPVDLDELRSAMAEVVEQAQQDDPVALRARIAKLEAEQARAKAHAPPPKVERVEVPVVLPDDIGRLEKLLLQAWRDTEKLAEISAVIGAHNKELNEALAGVGQALWRAQAAKAAPMPARVAPAPAPVRTGVVPAKAPSRDDSGTAAGEGGRLPRGARDMLTALASTLKPSLTRQQVAMLAGLKVTGGTFAKYLSILRTGGYVEDAAGGELSIAEAGLQAIGGRPPQPQSPEEVVALWKEKLPGKARDMLDMVVACTPAGGIGRSKLAQQVFVEESGGTFSKYLSLLSTNGLVEKKRGGLLVAAPDLCR